MKKVGMVLGCVAGVMLFTGCTQAVVPEAQPNTLVSSPSVGSEPGGVIDPLDCYISGDLKTTDKAVLRCGELELAQVEFTDQKPAIITKETPDWKVTGASRGTAEDKGFVRIQMVGTGRQCTYGRSPSVAPKETWVNCRPLSELAPSDSIHV